MAAAVAAAVWVGTARRRAHIPPGELESAVGGLPGFAGTLSLQLDGFTYSGQQAARIVALDVLVDRRADGRALAGSMRGAADVIRGGIDVYQRLVVTCYRREADFESGLSFAARGVWLAPELVAPLDGWEVIRLPDEPRAPGRALDGIYSRPALAVAEGGLSATVDLAIERRARPAADVREILSLPLIDCFDYDNAFRRSPGLNSLEVTVLSDGAPAARFELRREEFEATDITALLARLSREALAVSSKEFAIAARYETSELFTPLLFDAVVSSEDKAEIAELESRRRRAEADFYNGLFSKGVWEAVRPEADGAAGAHGEITTSSDST